MFGINSKLKIRRNHFVKANFQTDCSTPQLMNENTSLTTATPFLYTWTLKFYKGSGCIWTMIYKANICFNMQWLVCSELQILLTYFSVDLSAWNGSTDRSYFTCFASLRLINWSNIPSPSSVDYKPRPNECKLSNKNLQIEGKADMVVSSWTSVPAETTLQRVFFFIFFNKDGNSMTVSSGFRADAQLMLWFARNSFTSSDNNYATKELVTLSLPMLFFVI